MQLWGAWAEVQPDSVSREEMIGTIGLASGEQIRERKVATGQPTQVCPELSSSVIYPQVGDHTVSKTKRDFEKPWCLWGVVVAKPPGGGGVRLACRGVLCVPARHCLHLQSSSRGFTAELAFSGCWG